MVVLYGRYLTRLLPIVMEENRAVSDFQTRAWRRVAQSLLNVVSIMMRGDGDDDVVVNVRGRTRVNELCVFTLTRRPVVACGAG